MEMGLTDGLCKFAIPLLLFLGRGRRFAVLLVCHVHLGQQAIASCHDQLLQSRSREHA